MSDELRELNEVLDLIRAERDRQNAKWGAVQNNAIPEWGIILAEECGEVIKAMNEAWFRTGNPQEVIDELVQCAAVCVSIIQHRGMWAGGSNNE